MKNSILYQALKKHRIRRYLQMVFGIFLAAIAFNLFILPNQVVFGGVSGISIIVNEFYPISPSIFIFVSSMVLLLLSFLLLDKEKSMRSVVGSFLFPLFVQLTSKIDLLIKVDTEPLLMMLFGGVIYGFGVGLVFKAGFTTGGTDILNQIMEKYMKISLGNSMLIIDGAIVLLGAFVFGFDKFMYGILTIYLISFLTDKVLLGISDSKAFYIISSKPNEICDYVIQELNHSVTILDAKGGYSNQKNPVLFAVVPTKEYFKFKEGISFIDPNAFFSVVDAYEVMGGE